MPETIKYLLTENDIPRTWYNAAADLPGTAPILNPSTFQPMTREELAHGMPAPLVEQELSTEPEWEIPEEVRQIYAQWRPTPLYRARRLEKLLDTPARIYYKYEGGAPTGSFKPNTAVAQAYYIKQTGKRVLVAETGAGQWGSAVAFAAALFDMKAKVFMVRVSYNQKPYRRSLMETYGSICIPSPSDQTEAGRAILAETPDHPGSLGVAKSEALQTTFADPEAAYSRGSGLNYVSSWLPGPARPAR